MQIEGRKIRPEMLSRMFCANPVDKTGLAPRSR